MVNVSSGNLIVQSDDLAVPHKGIALAFRRTYNSQSNHDVNGDDGSFPGQYGNGWTNTFDAHIVSIAGGIRVFDIDGAAYDYTLSGTTYVPPAGQHSTLKSNGSCGFYWTKPTGTIYYFYGFKNATCGNPVLAYIGRLYQIIGRNNRNTITFSASWDNNNTGAGAKMSQLVATTESGLVATLTFADFSGHRLLQTLKRPDGVTLTYGYDSLGDLTDVALPDNGSVPRHETYGYVGGANLVNHGNSVLSWAASPRWAASSGADGGDQRFSYGGAALNQINHYATVDPTVNDGSVAAKQTASERAVGVSAQFSYDADGDVASAIRHHGCIVGQSCVAGTTQKRYDGADRLVETRQPHDPRTYQGTSYSYDGATWALRYIYDLSAGNPVSIRNGTAPFRAFGNLYRTQSLLPTPQYAGWMDVRGTAFDAMDRPTTKFTYKPAIATPLEQTQESYDGNGALGLRSSEAKPTGETASYQYDELARISTASYTGGSSTTPGESYVYDADGRTASVTSTVFGTQSYSYDLAGSTTDAVEPAGGSFTDPAHLTYASYGDGKRASVSVSSATFSQNATIAYSYRADGLLTGQTLSAFASGTWTKQYTNAGRLIGVSGSDSQGRAYDTAGELQSYSLPAGTISYAHDAEGSPTQATFPNLNVPGTPGLVTETLSNTYNVRGELIDSQYLPDCCDTFTHHRNGTDAGFLRPGTITSAGPDDTYMEDDDLVNAVRLDFSSGTLQTGSSSKFMFDPTGRQVTKLGTKNTFFPNRTGSYGTQQAVKTTTNFAFDASDHTTSVWPVTTTARTNTQTRQTTTTTYDAGTTSVGWGPNGHPIQFIKPTGYVESRNVGSVESVHWDGDMVLFVSDVNGNVVDFKVGLDGEVVPRDPSFRGLNVYDRDAAGVVVQTSNSTGNSGMSPLDPSDKNSPFVRGTPSYTPAGQVLFYIRPDGFDFAGLQISGVRAFDSRLGSWTTPDAYAGSLHDPASQMPYMWNRNNPYDYSDPSGYCVDGKDRACLGGVNWNAASDFANGLFNAMVFFLPGGFEGKASEMAAIGLAKQLASESQLANAQIGVGKAILGAGTRVPLSEAERLASQFGGKAEDWSKMTSGAYKAKDGTTIETHWYHNKVTGKNVEFKSKIDAPLAGKIDPPPAESK